MHATTAALIRLFPLYFFSFSSFTYIIANATFFVFFANGFFWWWREKIRFEANRCDWAATKDNVAV